MLSCIQGPRPHAAPPGHGHLVGWGGGIHWDWVPIGGWGALGRMWASAATAEYGHEADEWPETWKIAIQVPLWKNKGDQKNKSQDHGQRVETGPGSILLLLLSITVCHY